MRRHSADTYADSYTNSYTYTRKLTNTSTNGITTDNSAESPASQNSPEAVQRTPSNAKRGLFSLDGERVEYAPLSAVVMPAAATVLSV